ncbi:hypothetical protein E4665_03800 [Sporolactobacillus shoreae]|uniref:DUF2914 domain-containing protein n=1 Tax=Sporolactobacillus shoreae TaxID=1465501 RepID=A0A4Z0GSF7_9BACL|nr:hypothetical protein [Sporolactobacillus shoreae]TGA99457.1 hypothetical protein E4665_03800 [Sporolactobacillus shoreae]
MKKILKVFTALTLSLGILSGIAFTPQGITVAPQNVAYATTASIKVTSAHLSVYRGQYAYFTIQGKKYTKATINVYYKTGKSKAQGLGAKKTNSKGYVSWRWKVGTNTTPGTWKVYVKLGGQVKYLYLHVYKR